MKENQSMCTRCQQLTCHNTDTKGMPLQKGRRVEGNITHQNVLNDSTIEQCLSSQNFQEATFAFALGHGWEGTMVRAEQS